MSSRCKILPENDVYPHPLPPLPGSGVGGGEERGGGGGERRKRLQEFGGSAWVSVNIAAGQTVSL